MGAVAVALHERGFKVTGSDANVYPPMSSFLETKGIALMEGYRAENTPMDADVVSDKPGRCPKCGMNLVPKKPAEAAPKGKK